jgi:MoxR-like ATPase
LIEGVPGVGKTTLGQALARAIDCTFQRVQFTSDMLPSDVVGISIYSATRAGIRIQARPGVHQRPAGRRNQPHHAEDAVLAA